jgi:hypothetical protein
MDQPIDWETEAKQLLKAELIRAGVSYKVLASRLGELGVEESVGAIANKIARGRFTFVFFVQCMRAIGVDEVRVGERNTSAPHED